jgi:endonuclease YncB( thermonuclease family)
MSAAGRWRAACWLLLCACALSAGAAEEWVSGRVVSVTDGDTAVVETPQGRALRIRFYGVDAPENENREWPAQAWGAASTRYMRELLGTRQVAVRLLGVRTYGREVGEVFVDGRSASRELLRAGLGWWNRRYAPRDSDLDRLQAAARAARRGLWRDAEPVPPWVHRDRHRKAG